MIYGNKFLNEASKLIGKNEKYADHFTTSAKLKGKPIVIDSDIYQKYGSEVLTSLDEMLKVVNKEWDDILESVAGDFLERAKEIGDDKYKSSKDIINKIFIDQDFIGYIYFVNNDGKNKVGMFPVNFYTKPSIDNQHIYTKEIVYNFTKKSLRYDGCEFNG